MTEQVQDDGVQPEQDGPAVPEEEIETGGTGLGHRSVQFTRLAHSSYEVMNARGGTLRFGGGQNDDFTPVELLLTAIAGCSAIDVDFITSRRAEPVSFDVESSGTKARSATKGNHMVGLEVTFTVRFPEGPEGDSARQMLPVAIQKSHDRLCTVSRTVQLGAPIEMREA